MANGTIKFFNANKGFGFVTPDGGGADIFLPAAALTASGVAKIQPGQRVAFEQGPDKKGPKVIKLELVGEPIVKAAPASPAQRVVVYCDASSEAVADVLQVVHDGGVQVQLIDYTVTTPTPDQLRHLSHLLSGSGTSLVRRHDPLFSALLLDDRFISDQELWTAVAEHPTLINGPVLVLGGKARVCKTRDDAKAFLTNGGEALATKPKALSPRMAALIRGEVPATAARPHHTEVPVQEPIESSEEKLETATKQKAPLLKARPRPAAPEAKAKPASKPPVKACTTKAETKKAAPKPVRKSPPRSKK